MQKARSLKIAKRQTTVSNHSVCEFSERSLVEVTEGNDIYKMWKRISLRAISKFEEEIVQYFAILVQNSEKWLMSAFFKTRRASLTSVNS